MIDCKVKKSLEMNVYILLIFSITGPILHFYPGHVSGVLLFLFWTNKLKISLWIRTKQLVFHCIGLNLNSTGENRNACTRRIRRIYVRSIDVLTGAAEAAWASAAGKC